MGTPVAAIAILFFRSGLCLMIFGLGFIEGKPREVLLRDGPDGVAWGRHVIE